VHEEAAFPFGGDKDAGGKNREDCYGELYRKPTKLDTINFLLDLQPL
jgi:hypothetical protein